MGKIVFVISSKEYEEKCILHGETEMREMVRKGVYKIVDDNPPPKAIKPKASLLEEPRKKYFGFEDIVAEARRIFDA
jgi:hypothetical protein